MLQPLKKLIFTKIVNTQLPKSVIQTVTNSPRITKFWCPNKIDQDMVANSNKTNVVKMGNGELRSREQGAKIFCRKKD